MPISSFHATVTTTRAPLFTASSKDTVLTIRKLSNNNPVYLGDITVTPGNGLLLLGTEPITLQLANGDVLYGIAINGIEEVAGIATTD